MYKFIAILLLVSVISSCTPKMMKEASERNWWGQFTKPRPWGMAEVPDGTIMFKKGWSDGCETGMAAYGPATYKMVYKFKQDYKLINNQEYYRAWKDGRVYCRWYTDLWTRRFHGS